jgi:hypothetical protein
MPIDMKALARAGAEARISELLAEIGEIRKAFPGLKPATAGRRPGRGSARAVSVASSSKRRKRKPMSAAQKKAVGIRMKKYWSQRRKAEQKG